MIYGLYLTKYRLAPPHWSDRDAGLGDLRYSNVPWRRSWTAAQSSA